MLMATIAAVTSLLITQPLSPGEGGLAGGGPAAHGEGDCIHELARQEAMAAVQSYYTAHGRVQGYGGRATALYDFWPQAGVLNRDIILNNYIDMNPAPSAILDFECTGFTYDGHNGHDCLLRSFDEQAIGAPIFAIKPGVVVGRQDGNFDMHTTHTNAPANYVILDHGGDHLTYYWHLKNGSVAVSLGQTVRAGQQLGLAASSGYSNWPHLHFEAWRSFALHRPFTGACNPGASGWAAQAPIDRVLRVYDFGFSRSTLSSLPGLPHRFPTTPQIALSDARNWFWVQVQNLPSNSTWRVRYYRPNGTLAYDSGTGSFGLTTFYPVSWWYWWYNIADLHTISGTWRVVLDINGVTAVEGSLIASANPSPTFNRPPAPIQGLTFSPASPLPEDPIFCRVQTSLVDDDPDYDVVRYEYVWTVNGAEVRRVTLATHSDAIPAFTAAAGSLVRCTVTPKDALLSGPSSSLTVNISGCGTADFDGDGDSATDFDIEKFFECLAGNCCQTCWALGADFNGDGDSATDADIEAFFRVLAGGPC